MFINFLKSIQFIVLFFILILPSCGNKYDTKGEFISGFASVGLGGKFGVIDETGKEIVAPKYEEVSNFVGEYAKIKLNNKYGLINKKGEEVLAPKYDKIYGYTGDVAKVMLGSKYGMLDKKAKEVLAPKYDAVSFNIIGNYFEVSENGTINRIEFKAE